MQRTNGVKLTTLLTVLWLTMLATACGSEPATPSITATVPVPTPSGSNGATSTSAGKSGQVAAVEKIATIVAQRTPVPIPTPGPFAALLKEVVKESGLADTRFLGLMAEDWLNLGGSVLFVAIGSLFAIPMLFGLLNWVVRRTKTQFDDAFLDKIGRELRWLVVVILVRVAVLRLDPLSGWLRIRLRDLLFLLAWGVLYIISLRLIAFAADWYRARRVPEANRKRLDPFIEMVKRLGYLFVTTIAVGIVLSHYGINVTVPAAVFFFVLVVVALAAREAITDSVAGSFILLNQPFRVGDDIHLKELDTWGAVQEIGIRITRVLTLDNREVIIPNSLIGQSQVVNYSDPDPSLRVQTDIGVAYGTDLRQADRVIEAAVRGVEGVLPDKPVEVWFMRFGDYARRIWVLWWIDDINHEYPIRNHVNRAIELALAEAGIECPFPTYNLKLGAEAENGSPATQAFSDGGGLPSR